MNPESTPPQDNRVPFSQSDFERALQNYDYQSQKGQVVRGRVVEYGPEGAYIDIGGKSPGIVSAREAALEPANEIADVLPLDEEFEFLVVSEQDAEGRVKLSRRQFLVQEIWEDLAQLHEEGKTVEMRVSGSNRGGVTGEVMGVRGFIPRSHLSSGGDLEALIGQSITGALIEVDRERNKLVLSQREAAKASLMGRLIPGSLVEGEVVNLKPYGAFIDLGGITGLLHIKQISGKRIESLANLLHEGQQLKVIIGEVDEWKGRISLSLKELEDYPGELLEQFETVMATAESRYEKRKEESQE